MGTFAKMLGQMATRKLETESANIMRTIAANKVPGSLAQRLDRTLREGHDMKVFGLGTMASMANRGRYARFTATMHHVYSAMEAQLDRAPPTSPTHAVWAEHGDTLRRAPSLKLDLTDVVEDVELALAEAKRSPATAKYTAAINAAGDSEQERRTARLLGHLYCRYFADLFGGQMLGFPTRAALALPAGTPRHYVFDLADRRAYIDGVYGSLNVAGEQLPAEALDAVVQEAMLAFRMNVEVYSEEPMYIDAVKGGVRVCGGSLRLLASR